MRISKTFCGNCLSAVIDAKAVSRAAQPFVFGAGFATIAALEDQERVEGSLVRTAQHEAFESWLDQDAGRLSRLAEVSVGIPVYNDARGLSDTLESIVVQDFPSADYEAIVVDSRSQPARLISWSLLNRQRKRVNSSSMALH